MNLQLFQQSYILRFRHCSTMIVVPRFLFHVSCRAGVVAPSPGFRRFQISPLISGRMYKNQMPLQFWRRISKQETSRREPSGVSEPWQNNKIRVVASPLFKRPQRELSHGMQVFNFFFLIVQKVAWDLVPVLIWIIVFPVLRHPPFVDVRLRPRHPPFGDFPGRLVLQRVQPTCTVTKAFITSELSGYHISIWNLPEDHEQYWVDE